MLSLVATNIEQSFCTLQSDGAGFSVDFLAAARADRTYEEPFDLHGVTFRPVLFTDGTRIFCAQSWYMGFYAMQQAIRGLLLGVNYCVGGSVLVADELYGPAVASLYTGAYHALHGLLALYGRVCFDTTVWPIRSQQPSEERAQRIIAVLTQHNRWVFEFRPRNHRSRWFELRHIFGSCSDDLPQCFKTLFDYMYRGRSRPGTALIDVLKNPAKYKLQLQDKLEEFLRRIAETRHQSLYASFGSDPYVVEALWNGDTYGRQGIENQAISFEAFAHGLITQVATDLSVLTSRLSIAPNLRTALKLSVYLPWFDSPRIDRIANDALREQILGVVDWLSDRTGVASESVVAPTK